MANKHQEDLERLGIKPPVVMKLEGNSYKDKQNVKPEKKVEKMVTGKIVSRKKSLSKRFSEVFFGQNLSGVASYVIKDVIIPATKDTLSNMVSYGMEMWLYGEVRSTRKDKNKPFTSYSAFYKNDKPDNKRPFSDRDRSTHNFKEIIIETRGEAEDVLSTLVDLTIDYGVASVADLYEMVGITANFTDEKYGWKDLSGATVRRVREGYLLELPRTIVID